MTEASQIVRHLLENEEEMDDFDLDVGLPFSLESYLQKHRFEIAVPPDLGYDKLFDRGSSRLRVGHTDTDEGVRKVEYYSGNTPLWTKYLTDEEIVEMIDRNSRIGEAEEDEFADEDVDAWKDVADHLSMMLETAGFVQRGANVWTFGINQWMSVIVTRLDEGHWQGKVNFQGVGAINEFEGSEVEIARWLEASERWPKFHFSDWNRFKAAALGKTIRENEEEFADEDEVIDVGLPSIEDVLRQSGFQEHRYQGRSHYFIKRQGNREYMVWRGIDKITWYFHTYKKKLGQFRQDEQRMTEDPNELLGWLRSFNLLSEADDSEDEFGEDDWKDVSPPVNASEIQRWCFTDFELKKPTMCTGTDEFFADGDAELAVIVLRNGTVTDRWEDGTTGVPPHCAQMADLDESPVNPENRRHMFNEEDYYAENWRDVYVGKNGQFLGFVGRE